MKEVDLEGRKPLDIIKDVRSNLSVLDFLAERTDDILNTLLSDFKLLDLVPWTKEQAPSIQEAIAQLTEDVTAALTLIELTERFKEL